MAHPLLRPRWLIGTLLVIVIVVGCVSAGLWQLRRLEERRDRNDQVRSRARELQPLPPSGFAADADTDALHFRRVRVTGTFDPAHELLVRFRTRRGLPGYEVVTPLVTAAGVVLVDRGWVPLTEGDRWPVDSGRPPVGEVTVEGLLAPAEGGGARISRPEEPGRPAVVGAIDPRGLRELLPYREVYAVHLLAGSTTASAAYPVPVDPPDLGEGPHRDYAVQWFLFAAVGVIGWTTLLFRRGPLRRRTVSTEAGAPAV